MSDKNTNDINDITDGISENVSEADETSPNDDVSSDNKKKKKNKNSGKRKKQSSLTENRFLRILKLKRVWIPLALVLTVVIAYLTFIFAPFRPISIWRKLYIETAMTTGDHQWLATM